jgi:branched-chain amino acid transport system permease protein
MTMSEQETPAGALVTPITATSRTERFGVISRSTLLRHTLVALIGLGLLFALIQVLDDYRNTQLAPIALTVCAAAGLTLLVGLSGQISLGNGAFMFVGAYTTALLLEHWHTAHGNLQLIAVFAAAVVVSSLFGAVVGLAGARLRGPYLAGATLALAIGLPQLVNYQHLSDKLGGANGIVVIAPNPPPSFDLYRWRSVLCCISAVIVLWFLANVSRSRIGRSLRAVRDDEVAASLCGLSVARLQVLAFVISAGCAGLAGGLLAIISLVAGPAAFALSLSLGLLAAVVFGGLGSLAGAVYGSIVITLLPQWSSDFTDALSIHSDKITNNLPLIVYGVLLAVAMLAVPNGLQGAILQLRRVVLARVRR